MTRREVVIDAIKFRRPAYVPWNWGPTVPCAQKLMKHLGVGDLTAFLQPHLLGVGEGCFRCEAVDANHVRDIYGVVWDRSVDQDIGTPCDWPIRRPEDLDRFSWPDANNPQWYVGIEERLARHRDLFRIYYMGFTLFERSWTMRGMEDLLVDMAERPEFVERLLDAIVEHNLVQIHKALGFGVDAFYFGDDYGMQTGLIMGLPHWRHFIKPRLARMFAPVRAAGKFVYLHCCGKVDSIFDDLVEIGLNVFNPFQPDVMDVLGLLRSYRGRLAFHGGMSVQKVLPFGTVEQVREMTRRLIAAGTEGGYIFAPSHAVPGDVPPENLVAMMDVLTRQEGFRAPRGGPEGKP